MSKGYITPGGPIQHHTLTDKYRWRCQFTCYPAQYGRWTDSREKAIDDWTEHRTTHFPSGAQLMRAMGTHAGGR